MSVFQRWAATGLSGLAVLTVLSVVAVHVTAVVQLDRLGTANVSLLEPLPLMAVPTFFAVGAAGLCQNKRYWLSISLAIPGIAAAAFLLLVQLASRGG